MIAQRTRFRGLTAGLAAAWCAWTLDASAPPELWLTDPGGLARFERRAEALVAAAALPPDAGVEVDPGKTFQEIDGFGYTLTGGSARHLRRMSAPARQALIAELFGLEGAGLGVSCLRLSIGASDLDARPFSYCDLPPGETDPELTRFSLDPDRAELLPALKQILAVSPALKLMASPWSAPAWMKSNGDTRGGSLKPEWYGAYARYFVKYLQAMAAEGIRIEAVTVQNEPLHPGNNPSMFMPAEAQAEFIKRHLGPALRAAGLATGIVCYDHNADRPDYPLAILNDPEAKAFVAGSAFHLYAGKIEALSRVHEAHPDRHLYFTEQWTGGPGHLRGDLAWHVEHLVVGATRNWCRTVLEWNLSSDPGYEPHTDRGGCDRCLGAVTLDGDRVTRNPAYYVIAHASKFVRPGSVRIASTVPERLPNVAFRTPAGAVVVVLLNGRPQPQAVGFRVGDHLWQASLPPGAVATCVWEVPGRAP